MNTLAIINGLITSIILETLILIKQMDLKSALKTAFGMSFISMVGMEISMNITDVILTGGATITWWATPIMLFMGFITPIGGWKSIIKAVTEVYKFKK